MFTKIILTILTVVLITMTVILVIWWRKYGKELFQVLTKVKNLTSQLPFGNPMTPQQPQQNNGNNRQIDPFQNQNMSELMDRIRKMNEMMGKMKR